MATARFRLVGAGTSSSALAFGGTGPAITGVTEEYNDYSPYAGQTVENVGQVWYNDTTKELKFTDEAFSSAWATGNNLNTARYQLAGAGTQTAGLAFGGTPNLLQEQQKNTMEQIGQQFLLV
jgi:hypothetical protein